MLGMGGNLIVAAMNATLMNGKTDIDSLLVYHLDGRSRLSHRQYARQAKDKNLLFARRRWRSVSRSSLTAASGNAELGPLTTLESILCPDMCKMGLTLSRSRYALMTFCPAAKTLWPPMADSIAEVPRSAMLSPYWIMMERGWYMAINVKVKVRRK
ncbi:hypothetical protein H0G86_004344 [Trichoderma simmonsii]|uniref:Uncharacterized protein n=1 Tax=Trichoderma simmonsii TaxID=1491479 RepID=A0A8G0L9G4_9HYPO|nr:hypothetical protein H0G86_004344 [Trichoderma simmonsii]